MDKITGIDIGSSYIAAVSYADGEFNGLYYAPHKGDYEAAIKKLKIEDNNTFFTGINSFKRGGCHPFFALIHLSRSFKNIRHILYVGAGSYFIINLDEEGTYTGHLSNTTCASGTGAFLDLQAYRLGYKIEELGERSLSAKVRPSISTRCSVFAKTDLIHLQQEGYSKEDIAAGLCNSMAENIIDNLFKGSPASGKVLLAGGVFQNPAVYKAFQEKLGENNIVCEDPQYALAFGVIHSALRGTKRAKNEFYDLLMDAERLSFKAGALKPKTEHYPDFDSFLNTVDADKNEITVYAAELLTLAPLPVYLGIDIGSTSTKLCVIDESGQPVLSIYRKTSSDPINAVKLIFKALKNIEAESGFQFIFKGVATTGSGRKMIKEVINADGEINEITAHAKAAVFIDKDADTIIEIGGQDSKFTKIKNGLVYYSVMNYVCAAGTGSFIEEQAEKLGIPIGSFSALAENRTPPPTSDRCTVFMEKDIDLLIAQGVPKDDIAAAVLVSVRDNYLNKVVGNVPMGERVHFQGATARNRSLVAAFEQRLQNPIVVSPYCHITGALGAALHIKEKGLAASRFIGLSFCEKQTILEKEECKLCVNKCALSIIKTENSKVAWGMKCGKEYGDVTPKKSAGNRFVALHNAASHPKDREYKNGAVYVPDFLANAEKKVFLHAFLEALDIKPVMTHPSKHDYEIGRKKAFFEVCAPCVMTFGALSKLKDMPILFPHFLRSKVEEGMTQCHLCPLTQAMPSILKTQHKNKTILAPKVFETVDAGRQAEEFYSVFKGFFPVGKKQIKDAITHAYAVAEKDALEKYAKGDEFLRGLKDDEIGIVVLGRPYVVYNERLNHRVIDTFEGHGIKALPVDYLKPDLAFLQDKFSNLYWSYGQIIISSLKTIAGRKNLFPVFFSCFSCGPDSFILNYFYKEMEALKKPYLALQFDGHSAATGYLTRIEAAIDSFKNYLQIGEEGQFSPHIYELQRSPASKDKTVLIPPMEPDGARLISAAFKGVYKDSEVLSESDDSFREGLNRSIGHECSPYHSTLGALLKRLKDGNGNLAYFMPSGIGPCRFGQYATLQSVVLKEMGINIDIISPSDRNAYDGLPQKLKKLVFDAIIMNDVLKKILLSVRPYEQNRGETDRVYEEILAGLCAAFEKKGDFVSVFKGALQKFKAVPVTPGKKPRIGIVGEIYVRNNVFLNDQLIRTIEALGGEASISSVSEWFFYTLLAERKEAKLLNGKNPMPKLMLWLKNNYYNSREHLFYSEAKKYFPVFEPRIDEVMSEGAKYLPEEFLGEAILTVGRSIIFIEKESVAAIVNASPTFCMPGTLSSYLLKEVEKTYKTPVISMFYDKTGRPNMELVPYMELLKA